MNTPIYLGIVEDRNDPLKLGRCKVRVMGQHTYDKSVLPTEDLPWSYPMQPVVSAAMNGIGYTPIGPVEGTTVVIMFVDAPENQQPVMVGTLGGIPQPINTVTRPDQSPTTLFQNPNTGISEEIATTPEEATSQQAVPPVVPPTQTPSQSVADIPSVPPPSWRGDRAKATAGIAALKAAAASLGFTKEQTCTLLACAGGESGWIPQEEGYNYSAASLQSTFVTTFGNDPAGAEKWSRAPSKGISRQQFFDYVYDPSRNGRQLGNTQPGDGGKYYGRGFLQLTGRSNYTKYGNMAGANLVGNPGLLNSDLATSAKVAALYLKDRTSKSVQPTDNPGWFYAGKRAIGNDTGNGAAVRQSYYEYFYGSAIPGSDAVYKDAGTGPVGGTGALGATGAIVPAPSEGSGIVGFKDPNNKYPLKAFIKEPDTNRLARGIVKGTVVPLKEATRVVGVRKALTDQTFSEPEIPFGAKYPFNHVHESESGHVHEIDDTPGYERLHTYHRKGTYEEIDANGTKVNKIVGDNFVIIERNNSIYIAGEANLTVDGNINILCQSQANIEVLGDANMQIGGDYNLKVAKNWNISVGDTVNWKVKNTVNVNVPTLRETTNSRHVYSNNYYETVKLSYYRHLDDKYTYIGKDTYTVKEPGYIDYNCPTDRSGEQACPDITAATQTNPEISYREPDVALNPDVPYLVPPGQQTEDVINTEFETEEDWATPAGQAAKAAYEAKYGKQTPDNTPSQDTANATGGSDTTVPVDCKVIDASANFTADFRLSQNITLGMMFDGGFNVKHILRDQCGLTKAQIVCNLAYLAQNVIEPYIANVLPGGLGGMGKLWRITSGYRMGESSSQHNKGQACDIALIGGVADRNQRTFDMAKAMEKIVPYDQIILEYRGTTQNWVHTSYNATGRRKMAFTMLNDVTYGQGFSLL